MTHVGVVTFPNTLNGRDAARAVEIAGMQVVSPWHKDVDLRDVDAVVIPGGSSCGDYLRRGAIVATAPVTSKIMYEVGRGLPALGTCNGFQVLCESYLLPGVLIHNDHQRFLCHDQVLHIEGADTAWTRAYDVGDIITVSLKNGEGNSQMAPAELERLEGEDRAVFHYVDFNPNSSVDDITSVINAAGNTVSLMPHLEHATEVGFGPLSLGSNGASHHGDTDGLGIFRSVLASLTGW